MYWTHHFSSGMDSRRVKTKEEFRPESKVSQVYVYNCCSVTLQSLWTPAAVLCDVSSGFCMKRQLCGSLRSLCNDKRYALHRSKHSPSNCSQPQQKHICTSELDTCCVFSCWFMCFAIRKLCYGMFWFICSAWSTQYFHTRAVSTILYSIMCKQNRRLAG